MMKSLYSGVAGLKTHNQRMDVIGNNISNVNTTAFKASAVSFKDIFYQSKSRASTGDNIKGGTNANQVGYGAALSSIAQLMTQSGLQYSDKETDCAIYGEGFFQVMDQAGNIYYTRAGVFHVDNAGNLCDPNGYIVLGVSGDPTGVAASSQRINLYVPPIDNKEASVTKTINLSDGSYTFTVSASTYGEDGNISLNFVNSKVPFASQNGSTITISLDLEQDFQNADEFADAVNDAIEKGGITLADGILPLEFDFVSVPQVIGATTAENTMEYTDPYIPIDDDGVEGTPVEPDVNITFASVIAGDYANSYEIDIVTNSKTSEVKARWDDNILIITVPSGEGLEKYQADNGVNDITQQAIQDAIDRAMGGNPNRRLTVTGGLTEDDIEAIAGNGVTLRIGLTGGKDNFFKTLAESMGTIKLTDGRTAALQTTEDLKELFIDDDGVIYGVHSVHGTIALGRIDLVLFENPEGLNQSGTSYWTESLSSGDPNVVTANSYGSGSIISGALEMSNADLAQEISDMIITQRGYQANTRVITVSDSMLEELVNLKR